MLFLAIMLTIASAICFAAGFALAGYVIVTKIRQSRQGASTTESPAAL